MRVHVLTSVIATFASACTFSIRVENTTDDAAPSDTQVGDAALTIDARTIDAALPIDAAPDAMPVWVQIDAITVPCTGAERLSNVTLAASTTYRLRATGTCVVNDENIGADVRGDAEYIWNSVSVVGSSGGVDIGIAINNPTPGATKAPAWGSYTTTHEYSTMWTGLGARIVAKYHDPNYSNNSGQLNLFIDALQ